MTESQQTLLRKVAKRMPEVFELGHQFVYWKGTSSPVTERELLHVAAEFEKRMTLDEQYRYDNVLYIVVNQSNPKTTHPSGFLWNATPEQRFTARLKMWGEM
jgi:hypothetical protein